MSMRIDKFLKVSRLIKRRELAKDLCDAGDVMVNGRQAKPSTEVNEGDKLSISIGRHRIEGTVLSIRAFANKEQATGMFRIEDDQVIGKE